MAPTIEIETPSPEAPGASPGDLEALIEEARGRQRKRRLGIVAVLAVVAVGLTIYLAAVRPRTSSRAGAAPSPAHLCVRNEPGWRSRSVTKPGIAPALLLTNFRFGRTDYLNGHTDHQLRWPHGGILISISDWTAGATGAMKPQYRAADALQISANDFSSFEGVSNLGRRHLRLRGRLVELWVQARPTTATTIAAANRELRGVQVCS